MSRYTEKPTNKIQKFHVLFKKKEIAWKKWQESLEIMDRLEPRPDDDVIINHGGKEQRMPPGLDDQQKKAWKKIYMCLRMRVRNGFYHRRGLPDPDMSGYLTKNDLIY